MSKNNVTNEFETSKRIGDELRKSMQMYSTQRSQKKLS